MAVNTVSSDAEDTEEEEEKEKEEEEEEEDQDQKLSVKTIWALLSIMRMLTESGKIQQVVTSDDIQHAAFKETIFTEKEKMVAAIIQCMDDNQFPEPNVLIHAPLAVLANIIATITGFPFLIQKVLINSQQGSCALYLTAASLDIPVDDTNWITNSYQRLTFVNKWTVHLLGKAKPGKTFLKSNYEARKKGKINVTKSMPTTEMLTLDHLKMEALAKTQVSQVKHLTSTLRSLHKEISQLELNQMDIG
ncbi:hypothetical protein BC938DRAFT_481373 [Jimgerdemannia flammicorona]|uniref:Uncharacterized protein n=1 Tax=Jimgerdemannia flammicorona TaxID=994334 RepID=A0A433QX29_9FUNG|nr:hypothetical protein BC938DRAFT_481373 [Jimgerdemannia flammicorona]